MCHITSELPAAALCRGCISLFTSLSLFSLIITDGWGESHWLKGVPLEQPITNWFGAEVICLSAWMDRYMGKWPVSTQETQEMLHLHTPLSKNYSSTPIQQINWIDLKQDFKTIQRDWQNVPPKQNCRSLSKCVGYFKVSEALWDIILLLSSIDLTLDYRNIEALKQSFHIRSQWYIVSICLVYYCF